MDVSKIDLNMADDNVILKEEDKWYDLNNPSLRGLAFNNGYCRLPKESFISDGIETLKYHPSGANITFRTNANYLKIKANLKGPSYMSHMTGVGQVGFDLYYLKDNQYVFIASTKTSASNYEILLVDNLNNEMKEFRIYFPLYQGVNEAYIGVNHNAQLTFIKEKQDKITVYGTSISQGGCATRPGMAYTNILDRLTNYEIINLGFSGSAHLEQEMINVLNLIDSKILILEIEANNSSEDIKTKLPNFIESLICPKIILITHFPNASIFLNAWLKETFINNFKFQASLKDIILIDGNKILEETKYDATVDGTHLTDLGFFVLAKNLLPYLK